jgi:hypothetical protein
MATSPTPRHWILLLAGTAVLVTAAFEVRRHLAGKRQALSNATATPTTATATPTTATPTNVPATPTTASPASSPAPVHVAPGDEIFAIGVASVVEVVFAKADRRIVIHRKQGPRGGFTIANEVDGSAGAPSCVGSSALDELLGRLTSIRVERVIARDEAATMKQRFGATSATLRIRDDTVLDPKEFLVLFPEQPPPRALLLDGPALYETSIPRELFDRLAGGCAALGRR